MRITAVLLFVFLSVSPARADKEPSFVPPLASGGAPECSEHLGVRNYKSEIAKNAHTVAYITGVASLGDSGCQRSAELHIEEDGTTRSYQLPEAKKQDFSIADFSPDGSKLLLFAVHRDVSSGEEFPRYRNSGRAHCLRRNALAQRLGYFSMARLRRYSRAAGIC